MYKVSLKGKKGEKWRSTSNNWIPKDKDFEKEKKTQTSNAKQSGPCNHLIEILSYN